MDDMEKYYDSGDSSSESDSGSTPDKMESHTELVSRKLLGLSPDEEAEPGHKCTITVVADRGEDGIEVKYDKAEKHDAEKEMPESPDEDQQLAQMTAE